MGARLVDIVSRADPAIHAYVGIRERDLARGLGGGAPELPSGGFVAEGEVVVRVLATRALPAYRVRSLLVERRRMSAIADVLESLPDDVPAYIVAQDVMDDVVGFSIHRGILALGERGAPLAPEDLLQAVRPGDRERDGSRPLAVGLVGLTNHDNVGSVFRNAAAFGARGVLLDPATCDPLYRKAIRVSVGGALVVPFARCASAHALLDVIEQAGWEALALTARGDERLAEVAASAEPKVRGRVLLLGTEGDGLPKDVLDRARRVRIDMMPTLDSLNVAVASGIALYEATRRALR